MYTRASSGNKMESDSGPRWKVIVGLVARWKTWSNLFVQSLIIESVIE